VQPDVQNEKEPTYTIVRLAADETNPNNPYATSLKALKGYMGDRGTVASLVMNNYTGEIRPGVVRVELHDMSLDLKDDSLSFIAPRPSAEDRRQEWKAARMQQQENVNTLRNTPVYQLNIGLTI
jgi:hypothetical protein